jgi:hypothetical protein
MQQKESGADPGNRRWPVSLRRLIHRLSHRYRPERHYMRGGNTAGAVSRHGKRVRLSRH